MRITLLCPTLGAREHELARLVTSLNDQTYTDFELVVVSQGNHARVAECLKLAQFRVLHVHSDTVGISAARNAGIHHVTGDILMLSDDDCWYHQESLSLVARHFTTNPSSHVICFKHVDPEKGTHYREYPRRARHDLTYRELLSVASIDICFNMRLCGESIWFDENFGVGTQFNAGEECILLTDLKRRGFRISYVPKLLAYHPTKEVPRVLGQRELETKAAIFRRLYGRWLGWVVYVGYVGKNVLEGRGGRDMLVVTLMMLHLVHDFIP